MSSDKEILEQLVAEQAELDRRKKDLAEKELKLRERRVNNDFQRLETNDKELTIAKTTNYGGMTDTQIADLQRENLEYFEAARKRIMFINKEFNNSVPFFKKNLILIGGKTGEGKSTAVANVVTTTMNRTNPDTGRRCRVLVFTNEEKSEDVYNRVTCFAKGWHYVNHDKFTLEQVQTFDKYMPILAKDGWLTVIDDRFGSTPGAQVNGVTTSVEGIQTVFDAIIRDGIHYDAIVIDYYQNVSKSKLNPNAPNWQIQEQFASMLDQYKNVLPCPIVLMAQVSPPDEDNTIPFKVRIEGRKSILNVATCCIEMVKDATNRCTQWIVHKSRFNETIGGGFKTGYDKGRFVEYTDEFKRQVNAWKEIQAAKQQDKDMGIKVGETDGTKN
jgi:hypothetical protein